MTVLISVTSRQMRGPVAQTETFMPLKSLPLDSIYFKHRLLGTQGAALTEGKYNGRKMEARREDGTQTCAPRTSTEVWGRDLR